MNIPQDTRLPPVVGVSFDSCPPSRAAVPSERVDGRARML